MRIVAAAFAMLAIVFGTPALADASCSGLISALVVEDSAHELAAAQDGKKLAEAVDNLHRALAPHLGRAASQGKMDAADAAAARFFSSRAAAVEAFRRGGAEAGRRVMADPRYQAVGEEVRQLVRDRGCGDAKVTASGAGKGSFRGLSKLSALAVRFTTGTIVAVVLLVAMVAVLALLIAVSSWFDKRREKRYACDLATWLRIGDEPVKATIVNLSRSGAQVRTSTPLEQHQKCELLINGEWIGYKVVWVNVQFAGGAFPRKLDRSARSVIAAMNAEGEVAPPPGAASAA